MQEQGNLPLVQPLVQPQPLPEDAYAFDAEAGQVLAIIMDPVAMLWLVAAV